jgi:hypothetical protein
MLESVRFAAPSTIVPASSVSSARNKRSAAAYLLNGWGAIIG